MILSDFASSCRERAVSAPITAGTLPNADQSILTSLSAKHRITMGGGFKFNKLSFTEVKQLYQEAVDHVLKCQTRNLAATEASSRVALTYNIVIEVCDRNTIKSSVNARLKAATKLQQMEA